MPSLAGLLNPGTPEIDAFNAAQELERKKGTAQISQLSSLAALMQHLQAGEKAQREEAENQQIAATVKQAGGDPTKALSALLSMGTPRALMIAEKMKGILPKAPEDRVVSPGGVLVGPTGNVKYQAPFKPEPAKEFAPPEIIRLQEMLGKLPEGSTMRPAIVARIKLLTERAPGVTVNMPASSDLMQAPDGSYVRVRIGKDGKVEQVPLGNVRPPQTGPERKAATDEASAAASLEGVRARIAKMTSLIQGGGVTGSVVGPLGAVGRVAETAIGTVQPGAATPSLDYDNEKALLLADVRKVVEKDPNLSNQERQTLYQTLGGGIMQTPGSAMRTLNNVMEYVEGKRKAAPAQPRSEAVPPSAERKVNAVYDTPKGKMKWTGTGWLPAN